MDIVGEKSIIVLICLRM